METQDCVDTLPNAAGGTQINLQGCFNEVPISIFFLVWSHPDMPVLYVLKYWRKAPIYNCCFTAVPRFPVSDGDIRCCCKAHLFPHPPGNDRVKRAGEGENLAGGGWLLCHLSCWCHYLGLYWYHWGCIYWVCQGCLEPMALVFV